MDRGATWPSKYPESEAIDEEARAVVSPDGLVRHVLCEHHPPPLLLPGDGASSLAISNSRYGAAIGCDALSGAVDLGECGCGSRYSFGASDIVRLPVFLEI